MWLVSDAVRMVRDLRENAPWLDFWGAALNMPQLIGGLVFWRDFTANLVLAGVFTSIIIASQIHKRRPYSRLAGLCHVIWLPLIPMLAAAAIDPAHGATYRIWAGYVLVTMSVSIILDAYDLYRFWLTDDKTYLRAAAGDSMNAEQRAPKA